MICQNCGNQNDGSSKLCAKCWEPLYGGRYYTIDVQSEQKPDRRKTALLGGFCFAAGVVCGFFLRRR